MYDKLLDDFIHDVFFVGSIEARDLDGILGGKRAGGVRGRLGFGLFFGFGSWGGSGFFRCCGRFL